MTLAWVPAADWEREGREAAVGGRGDGEEEELLTRGGRGVQLGIGAVSNSSSTVSHFMRTVAGRALAGVR